MAPFAAALIDRYGLRRVMIGAVVLIGAGLALSLWMTPGLATHAAVGRRRSASAPA